MSTDAPGARFLAGVEARVAAAGLVFRGAFRPVPDDEVPAVEGRVTTRAVVLVGFAGRDGWPAFRAAAEYDDGLPDPLDRWSRRIIDSIALCTGGRALYPSDGPPWLPFQRWARRAEDVHPSPLGILIHPDFGLWHAYRGAIAYAAPARLRHARRGASPCQRCVAKPCLSACPVAAVRDDRFDAPGCRAHLAAPAGQVCVSSGCAARGSCPVGRAHAYDPEQMAFHLRAFMGPARRPDRAGVFPAVTTVASRPVGR